jgi:enolase-phosphatase E1
VTAVPLTGVRSILLDIEGTTTPISFVYDVLFPYVRTNLQRHLERSGDHPGYLRLFETLREDRTANVRAGLDVPPWQDGSPGAVLASIVRYAGWLMDRDSKTGPLKQLQGLIWEDGYARGELIGEVFPDVPGAFRRWRDCDISLGIFSSGSVLAQQLLFRHSTAGDLTPMLHWYFDPTVGTKTHTDSYERIAREMGETPASVLFISDVAAELDAARTSGMQTRLSVRPGNKPVSEGHGHTAIASFDEVVIH